MNWFVIHHLLSYEQHPNMIGCKVKTTNDLEKKPKQKLTIYESSTSKQQISKKNLLP